MLGRSKDVLKTAGLHDLPRVHDRNSIGEVSHNAEVVRDQQHRH
jgi:hypothetical protein